MAHTPGPWKIWPDGPRTLHETPPIYQVVGGEDHGIWIAWIQYYSHYGAESLANARLIAAAPEMLEALKKITDEMELADFDPNDTDTWYGRALAIIAKAEGRA